MEPKKLWQIMTEEAEQVIHQEPALASYFLGAIINQRSFGDAVSFQLAERLESVAMPAPALREMFQECYIQHPELEISAARDLAAVKNNDPAVRKWTQPLLYGKGFHALQGYRISHWLWNSGKPEMASFIQSQSALMLGVDIHPAAVIGSGIMFDHATGIVIGGGTVVGDDVSFLQNITLGGSGSGFSGGNPVIEQGVVICADVSILGKLTIGRYSCIGAGSVVLDNIPPFSEASGVPAVITGCSGLGDCQEKRVEH